MSESISDHANASNGAMDITQIMAVLPHRYPLLLVDRVLADRFRFQLY